MAKDRHASVFTRALSNHIGNVLSGQYITLAVGCTFGDQHDGFASPCFTTQTQVFSEVFFPARSNRIFGGKHVVGTTGNRCHQG